MLDDGTYDTLIVDADDDDERRATRVELTIVSGAHKGELVAVHARGLGRDPVELLGLPATLVVTDGRPVVRIEG